MQNSETTAGSSFRTAGLPLGLQAWNSSCSCWFVWRWTLCPSGWSIATRGEDRSVNIRPINTPRRRQLRVPTLMKTARLWLAFLAASRLSLYFCVMCGMIKLTSVSTVWWKEAEKRWFLDNCRVKMEARALKRITLPTTWTDAFPFMLRQLYFQHVPKPNTLRIESNHLTNTCIRLFVRFCFTFRL